MAFFKLFCSLSTSSSKGWVFSFVPVNDLFSDDQADNFCSGGGQLEKDKDPQRKIQIRS